MQLTRVVLKSDFGPGTLSRGLKYLREGKVAVVQSPGEIPLQQPTGVFKGVISDGPEQNYTVEVTTDKGAIQSSRCECSSHGVYDWHCRHVAALVSWILHQQGELPEYYLQVKGKPQPHKSFQQPHQSNNAHGHANNNNRFPNGQQQGQGQPHRRVKKVDPARLPALKATPITIVKGLNDGERQVGITLEPGFRFKTEDDLEFHFTASECRYESKTGLWSAPTRRKLQVVGDRIPFLTNLTAQKMVYTGSVAVHMMSTLMQSQQVAQIHFDESLKLEVSMVPLKISTLYLSKKVGGGRLRELSFDFKNESVGVSTDEMKQLAQEGRVSGQFIWLGHHLYTFERSLDWIDSHASHDGEPSLIRGANPVNPSDLFPLILDDETHPLHPLAAFRMSLELGAPTFKVDEEWTEYHSWLETFERTKIPALPRVQYGFDLRDYQKNGLSWIWSLYHRGLAALLADDMGLGKTHQVLAFLSCIYKSKVHNPGVPSLVVAPTSVVAAWEQKLSKYKTGLRAMTYHGRERKLDLKNTDLVLTTYGILQRDEMLQRTQWHVIILDEAQSIKNPATLSARQARALHGKFRVVMTGTPVENSTLDLWSLMEFLLPSYLGSYERFKKLYVPREGMPSQEQAETVRRLVTPFLMRRTKSQVLLELPEKTEEIRVCTLTEEQQVRYNQYLQTKEVQALKAGIKSGGKIDYASILAILTRLKQVCDHPSLPDLTGGKIQIHQMDYALAGKWDVLTEILEEALNSGLKVVIFSQYLGVLDLISRYLKEQNIHHGELRGDTQDRGGVLQEFASDPECKVFLCSLLAGGMGIDLTSASVCVHFDRWWNPAKENQATDRLHRIGQTRGVQVFKLQIPGTIEERISAIIESKMALADALVEESAAGLSSFSRQELLDLLTEIPKV